MISFAKKRVVDIRHFVTAALLMLLSHTSVGDPNHFCGTKLALHRYSTKQ